jgi:hypothetical protein
LFLKNGELTVLARRTSSQKPGDEFIANFRQTFPEVAVATSSAGSGPGDISLGDAVAGGPHPDRYVDPLISLGLLNLGALSDSGVSTTVEKEALENHHLSRPSSPKNFADLFCF